MKTTLNIEDQILKKSKQRAVRDGITLTKFVEDALKSKLLGSQKKTTRYEFKPRVVTGSRPPNVDISDRDALYNVIDNS